MEGQAFSALLRRYRVSVGISQEALATRAGLSLQAVSAIERGVRRAPRRETVAAIAVALALNAEELGALEATVRRSRRPRAARAVPPGLPHASSPLIGREADASVLAYLLRQPHMRLLTVLGPGGIGKTRLARQTAIDVAGFFTDGVIWVDLSSVHDQELVAATIAARLRIRQHDALPLSEVLAAHIGSLELLLILDHLEEALLLSVLLQQLLDSCPGLCILATSRVPLRVRGAQDYLLAPLPLPPPDLQDPEAIGAFASVALFLDRARAIVPRLALTTATAPMLAELCRKLDGIPLAIELAAALVRILPPQAMLDHLSEYASLPIGAQDPPAGEAWERPEYQQTMRAAIALSYELLDPPEQTLFRRLAAFTSGWTAEAAQNVSQAPGTIAGDWSALLEVLFERHLVTRETGTQEQVRFSLPDTIRAFAAERLEPGSEEAASVEAAYAAYCRTVVER